jgi:hypothetical protein
MQRALVVSVLAVLVLLVAACGAPSGDETAGGGYSGSGSSGYNTQFPLPTSVINFTDTGNNSVNFQTEASLEDTLAFYRSTLGEAGLTERTINTAITDTTFSLVFDGDPSGKALVVQGVDLGNGTTNVNIRYEDV